MTFEDIAEITYYANSVYRRSIGESERPDWSMLSDTTKAAIVKGVKFIITSEVEVSPPMNHMHWMNHKFNDGWVYGEIEDKDKKTHPCLLPYNTLPPEQRLKDEIYLTIVKQLRYYITS